MIYVLKSDDKKISYDRELMEGVHILQILNIKYIPLIIKQDTLNTIDYVLVTSKHAIKAILNSDYATTFLQKPIIAIGESSKQEWIKSGGIVAMSQNKLSSGEKFADSIKDSIRGKHILYIHGKEIATNFKLLLSDICNITELIAYESYENKKAFFNHSLNCKDSKHMESKINFKDGTIFIFGSPKNYDIFTKYYTWNETWYAISLGDTTYNKFPKNINKFNANGNFLCAIKLAKSIDNKGLQ